MFDGLQIINLKGFTNLTHVHPFISKIALDSGMIDDALIAYNFPYDDVIGYSEINIGYITIPIPPSINIYGKTYQIYRLKDLLYLSQLPDIYDGQKDVVRRRIFHANIEPLYHGYLAGYGSTFSMFELGDKTKASYLLFTAYTNHYYQDAFAPMHISLKDQDVHIPFEHAYDKYLEKNANMIESETLDLLYKRSFLDISKYRGVNKFSMKYPNELMSIRESLVKEYRKEGEDSNFEGIEYFMYGAVLDTIAHTTDMISKDYYWRRLR